MSEAEEFAAAGAKLLEEIKPMHGWDACVLIARVLNGEVTEDPLEHILASRVWHKVRRLAQRDAEAEQWGALATEFIPHYVELPGQQKRT